MWRKEDKDDVVELDEAVKEAQGDQNLRDYAKSIGYSASYLSQVSNSVRPPSEELLEKLGLERRTIYIKKRRWK
jgi:transcriptional regulator with XRE-family HTH domain